MTSERELPAAPEVLEDLQSAAPCRRPSFEWEFFLLVILVGAMYLPWLGMLPMRGEESRRTHVAVEMAQTGDYVVPRQQRIPFLSRPPIQNWLIGMVGWLRGDWDVMAARLPSVAAVLLTTFLIYGYSRTFLTRAASLTAALAFASMAQVLELGRSGETDMLFTLFVSGSLLVWHMGRARSWKPAWTWTVAYLFVAFGMLTKGPQGPIFFALCVGAYLLWTRRLRDAFTWAHLQGIGLFLLIVSAWQVPYVLRAGWETTKSFYGVEVAARFDDARWAKVAEHLVVFPLELFASLLPWGILLLVFLRADFRRAIGSAQDHVVFLLLCVAVTVPTCWFPPLGRPRYFMPMYPCFAVLIGLVIERCWSKPPSVSPKWAWPAFGWAGVFLMVLSAAVMLVAGVLDRSDSPSGLPLGWAAVWAVMSFGLAALVAVSCAGRAPAVTGAMSIALFLGMIFAGPVTSLQYRASNRTTGPAVARLKETLPPKANLVSLSVVDHLFTYYYRDPIPVITWPPSPGQAPGNFTYFCFSVDLVKPEQVTFPHEILATIVCDRNAIEPPIRRVYVGRRSSERPRTASPAVE